MPNSQQGRSIRRALEVLRALGEEGASDNGGLSVTRLSELLGHDKSQISRALTLLAEEGFAERVPGQRGYRLGWEIYTLARRAARDPLVEEGENVVAGLVAAIEESCAVIVRSGDELLTVAAETATRTLKAVGFVGARGPLMATAAGRAMMSGLTRDEFDALLERVPPKAMNELTETDPARIWELVEADRERGWWLVDREYDLELCGIAAPVTDPSGSVVAVLSTAGPRLRLLERTEEIGAAVRAGAIELSSRMRGEPRPIAD
ncbi:IclR family transcriptional regulator [Thermoleophilia bacterium SCSIO 60948]|nr:IclR family transcriptional regulator [Thermoleophilia bacterium SCSIO 60948]